MIHCKNHQNKFFIHCHCEALGNAFLDIDSLMLPGNPLGNPSASSPHVAAVGDDAVASGGDSAFQAATALRGLLAQADFVVI